MKKMTGAIAAGVCGVASVAGALTLGNSPAHADSNCHAYGTTSAAAGRAINAACAEVNKGTPYSWGGGHHARPGPSTGSIYSGGGEYFDDRHKVGLDCSGLVRWAWFEATGTDIGAGGTYTEASELTSHGFTRVGAATQPGDVVIYNGHTVIYLGGGLIVQAQGDLQGLNVRTLSSVGEAVQGVYRYTGSGGTPPPPVGPPPSNGGGRYYQNVWMRAPSYRGASTATPAGHLNKGRNYFYCQARGSELNAEGYHNDWWLKTDDDSGNSNVWVNAVYVSSGSDDGQIPGVPTCAASAPAPAGKVYKNVWSTAGSYSSPTSQQRVGVLNAGRNYFYCQAKGAEVSVSGYRNNWWLKTDDDTGHRNVWVSAIRVSGGVNDGAIPGVPTC